MLPIYAGAFGLRRKGPQEPEPPMPKSLKWIIAALLSVSLIGGALYATGTHFSILGGVNVKGPTSDPASAVKGDLYFNTTSNKFRGYDGSAWGAIGGGGGGTGINYVGLSSAWVLTGQTDIDAETTIGNWLAYADAGGADPVDMTGGSPTTTCLRTTTAGHILDGTGSFEMIETAANLQGEGCAVVVYVPPAYRGQLAQIQIPVSVQSGSIACTSATLCDVMVKVYDVTNSVLLAVTNGTVSGSGVIRANVTIPATTAQIRLGFHKATTVSTALTLDFDDVIIGPPSNNVGNLQLTGNWTAYTPTFAGMTPTGVQALYKRVGDSIFIMSSFTPASITHTIAQMSLPAGLTVNQSLLTNTKQVGAFTLGTATAYYGTVLISATYDRIQFGIHGGSNAGTTQDYADNIFGGSFYTMFAGPIPITEWTGSNAFINMVSSEWKNDLTWTVTGFGTPSLMNFWYKRVGDMMMVRGSFTSGVSTAVLGTINLPSGLTIDSTKFSSTSNVQGVGIASVLTPGAATQIFSSANDELSIVYDGSTTSSLYITARSASATFNQDAVTNYAANTYPISFKFEIPITQWASTNVTYINNAQNIYSAEVGVTGTVTNEIPSGWVTGNCALASSVFTCTLDSLIFSATPVCQSSVSGTSSGDASVAPASSTSVVVRTFAGTTGLAADRSFSLTCHGLP